MPEKEGRLSTRALKTLLTRNTKSSSKHHNNQAPRINLEKFEMCELILILGSFIQILKSFSLFSVFYSQSKVGNFGGVTCIVSFSFGMILCRA